jgi:hypothetical protein
VWDEPLPREHPAPAPELGGSYASQNLIPVLNQVWPSRIKKEAQGKIEGVRREHVSQELIRNIFPAAAQQFAHFKDFFEITVAFDNRCILDLKVGLGEFCLEQDRAQFHVDFGSLDRPAGQRNTWLESKLRQIAYTRP